MLVSRKGSSVIPIKAPEVENKGNGKEIVKGIMAENFQKCKEKNPNFSV